MHLPVSTQDSSQARRQAGVLPTEGDRGMDSRSPEISASGHSTTLTAHRKSILAQMGSSPTKRRVIAAPDTADHAPANAPRSGSAGSCQSDRSTLPGSTATPAKRPAAAAGEVTPTRRGKAARMLPLSEDATDDTTEYAFVPPSSVRGPRLPTRRSLFGPPAPPEEMDEFFHNMEEQVHGDFAARWGFDTIDSPTVHHHWEWNTHVDDDLDKGNHD